MDLLENSKDDNTSFVITVDDEINDKLSQMQMASKHYEKTIKDLETKVK